MMQAMPRLVVFDLAGTTMQDDGAVAALFRATLASVGLESTEDEIAQVRGASKREAFRRFAGEGVLAERLLDAFLSGLRQHYSNRPPREVPGAAAIFAWLHAEGTKVALNTGFETEMVKLLVDALGWGKATFDTIVCGDEVKAGRPSPAMIQESMRRVGLVDPATVMAVGDTVLDLQAGMAAQAGWVVGVTSGAHGYSRLLETPHTHLIASVAGIRELLR
jgi:phosphonatase-like hydrolase